MVYNEPLRKEHPVKLSRNRFLVRAYMDVFRLNLVMFKTTLFGYTPKRVALLRYLTAQNELNIILMHVSEVNDDAFTLLNK